MCQCLSAHTHLVLPTDPCQRCKMSAVTCKQPWAKQSCLSNCKASQRSLDSLFLCVRMCRCYRLRLQIAQHTQQFAHAPAGGWGKNKKKVEFVGWDKGSLIGENAIENNHKYTHKKRWYTVQLLTTCQLMPNESLSSSSPNSQQCHNSAWLSLIL